GLWSSGRSRRMRKAGSVSCRGRHAERLTPVPSSGVVMEASFLRRGFLPEPDPLGRFGGGSEVAAPDELGRELPSLLHDPGFRGRAARLSLPPLPAGDLPLPLLRLYYVRVGFLASAYINQVGQEPARSLPRNIAVPLHDVCRRLDRPPI